MDIPNLDAMEWEDLQQFRTNLHRVSSFVTHTLIGRSYRLEGRIKDAQQHEFSADCIWRDLPDDWRW